MKVIAQIETVNDIVLEALREAIDCNEVEIELIKEKAKSRSLRKFEEEDLAYAKKLKKALKRSHNYFADWEDHI